MRSCDSYSGPPRTSHLTRVGARCFPWPASSCAFFGPRHTSFACWRPRATLLSDAAGCGLAALHPQVLVYEQKTQVSGKGQKGSCGPPHRSKGPAAVSPPLCVGPPVRAPSRGLPFYRHLHSTTDCFVVFSHVAPRCRP